MRETAMNFIFRLAFRYALIFGDKKKHTQRILFVGNKKDISMFFSFLANLNNLRVGTALFTRHRNHSWNADLWKSFRRRHLAGH